MNSSDRRLITALIVGAVVMGAAAPATDAPLFNLLVGLAYGVPAFIVIWSALEIVAWMTSHEQPSPPPRPSSTSNVHVIARHTEREDAQ